MLRKVTFEVGRAVRETGQALDRLGLRVLGDNAFNERCTSLTATLYVASHSSVAIARSTAAVLAVRLSEPSDEHSAIQHHSLACTTCLHAMT